MPAQWTGISIHALLAESDFPGIVQLGFHPHFYPRSPCGERQTCQIWAAPAQNFYPRSPCGERRVGPRWYSGVCNFYPRSPCGERQTCQIWAAPAQNFYPRSPCGERRVGPRWYSGVCNFYPRSPCGERLIPTLSSHAHPGISIHALLAESDPCSERQQVLPRRISIHALLAESDTSSGAAARPSGHFYPRSPCGERPQGHNPGSNKIDFYPRSPCGERLWAAKGRNGQKYFYPRSPCGERLVDLQTLQQYRFVFLSTLSLRRATSFRSAY